MQVGVLANVAGGGRIADLDAVDQFDCHSRLHGNVYWRADNLFPRRLQHNVSRFRIEPEVEFATGSIDELGVGGLRIQAGAHEDEFFGHPRKFGIDGDGQSEVRHWAALVNRYFVGEVVDHANQKVRCVFISGFGTGLAFGHFSKVVCWMIKTRGPGSQPGYGTVTLLPEFRFLFSSDQRILRTGHNWDVGSSDDLEHAQSVRDFGLEPLIAGHDGDAQDFGLWRLDQQQD